MANASLVMDSTNSKIFLNRFAQWFGNRNIQCKGIGFAFNIQTIDDRIVRRFAQLFFQLCQQYIFDRTDELIFCPLNGDDRWHQFQTLLFVRHYIRFEELNSCNGFFIDEIFSNFHINICVAK